MGIATDSYRVNKSTIPSGLVARAMVDVFSLCYKWSLHFPGRSYPGCIVKARLKALTHRVDGRPLTKVGPSVSICGPSFCGVSRTISSSRPHRRLSRPIQHVESGTETVCERNHSDWLFSLS